MSLKAIKKVVEEFEGALEHPNAPAELRVTWEQAKTEIDALEKAAGVLDASRSGDDYSETDLRNAYALMERITKEAK